MPFGRLIAGFGDAAYPPCLLVPALLLVSPLSGIPLFSSFCALVLILIAAQGAWGRPKIWLPRRLAQREMDGERLRVAAHALRHVVRVSEYVTRPRLTFLTNALMRRVTYSFIVLIAACVPMLELVPFSATSIGLVVAVLAIALVTRDGLVLIAGLGLAVLLGQFLADAVRFALALITG